MLMLHVVQSLCLSRNMCIQSSVYLKLNGSLIEKYV